MADVVSKSRVLSLQNDRNKGNIFPVKCSVSENRCKVVGFSSFKSNFGGVRISVVQNRGIMSQKSRNFQSIGAKMGLSIGKAQRWWEKGIQPNMREVTSAEDLVDSLLKAGDKLVVVDFFSPGCGGCRALHPKLCQLAEMNPDVQFLQVNYEEHKSMSYSLNVHVLPFFRFYRGAEGRLCSFSCTTATIKKFKDALAKYGPERCSLGPTKGLEEKELVALAANKELSFTYTPKPVEVEAIPEQQEVSVNSDAKIAAEKSIPSSNRKLLSSTTTQKFSQQGEEALTTARR